ncbi:MAG: 2-aminomuconate deaminase [Ignavibacteria bacterium]|nr:2-aminomuconate deaminase [Ignavibacteria bacterium]
MSERIISSNAPEPVGLYPHARKAGNLLFLSGIGPREKGSKKIPGVELDEKGNIVSYDIELQCRSVFKNVKQVLEDSGSGWEKLVDVTVYLTNMKDDFPVYNKIYAEYFKDNQPCRTTVEISSLPTPIAIELKCIAEI